MTIESVESVGVLTRSRTSAAGRLMNDQHESMNPPGTKGSTEIVDESTSSSTTNEGVGTKQMLETLMVQNRMLMELLSVQQKKSSDEVTFAPDFHKSIPAFNGLNPGFQALDWLNTVNSVANLNRWPDNFKLQSVRTNLEGPARHWFSSREIVSWADFENQFKRTFVGEVSIGDRWKEMVRCVQQKGENVLEYFHKKMHLCSSLNLSFCETKMQVLEGLYSKELSMHLLSRNHTDSDELLNDILSFERLDASRALRIRQYTSAPKELSTKTPASTRTTNTRQTATSNSIVGGPVRICFNCGSKSHIASSCTKPRIEKGACYQCGSTTHQRSKCPSLVRTTKKQEETSKDGATNDGESRVMNVNYERPKSTQNHPGPYEVICECNFPVDPDTLCGITFVAIIDTGSPISLLKRELLPNNPDVIKPLDNSCNFSGINGTKLELLGIFETEILIYSNMFNLRFYVVPGNTMVMNAILGRDFVNNPNVNLCFQNGSVRLNLIDNINRMNGTESLQQILCVDYEHEFEGVKEIININPKAEFMYRNEFLKLYNDEYVLGKRCLQDSTDPNLEMKIILKHDQPISYRARRISYSDREKLKTIIDDLSKEGIIRPSRSPYSSPIVLVRKKTGDLRLCVDYRELNKITVKDNFPAPLIDDQIDKLKNKKYFSLLDLKNGFHHVRMNETSIPFTSFVTPLGQFEYLKMPFGLTNAPKVFSRFTQQIFADLIKREEIILYMDDILIATEAVPEHFIILKKVFNLAAKFDLKFRLDKCSFLYSCIEYLGYIIDEVGVRPSPRNIDSVKNYPVPTNQKQVRQFLGLASYFRRFIPNFSLIAKPLHNLLKKEIQFVFGNAEQCAFDALKNQLSEAPILSIYSPSAETELHCDASSYGYGSVLLQKQVTGKLHPVFYFSQRTTQAESRYHSFELECLAVVYSIKRFHVYLAGIHFKIITDCNSFRLTLEKQNINPRISRWALFLQNYDFEIAHRPGTKMGHVDALSRCHNILVLEANTFEQILSVKQGIDEKIVEIRNNLEKKSDKHFELREGLVYRKDKGRLLFYVPKAMESNVIRSCHDDMAHIGLEKVVENIRRIYWFPDMKLKVRDYIFNCLKCIEYSPITGKREGYLHNIPKGDRPFLTVHVDHLGPLEKTKNSNKFILVVIDSFSKFVKCYPSKTTKTEEVVLHLKNYFRTYSKPKRLVSDRGTAFTSNDFKTFLLSESVEQILIATGTPRANGQVEIVNRSIVPMLAKISEPSNEWDRVLYKVEFAINNTIHRSTGQTPSRLLFGINQVGDVSDELRHVIEEINENRFDLPEIREKASEQIVKAQTKSEEQYNVSRKEPVKYSVGDYVMIKNVDVTHGVNKKLIPKFKGPYVVRKVLDYDRYVIGDIEGNQITQRPYEGIIGPDQMKRWVTVSEAL